MVKKTKGTQQGNANNDIVVSTFKPARKKLKLGSITQISGKKRLYALSTALLIVAIVGTVVLIKSFDRQPSVPATIIQSEETVLQAELQRLLQNSPGESQPLEDKITYYDDLTYAYANNGRYQEAVTTFAARQDLQSTDLDYRDYIRLATYAYQAGDKVVAGSALDSAASLLPEDGSENVPGDYSKQAFIDRIAYLREEFSK